MYKILLKENQNFNMGQIIILVVLILINAFFAATEIAFISLNDAKIEKS